MLSAASNLSYVISDLNVTRSDADRGLVTVAFDVEGKRRAHEPVEGLQGIEGVIDVRTGDSAD